MLVGGVLVVVRVAVVLVLLLPGPVPSVTLGELTFLGFGTVGYKLMAFRKRLLVRMRDWAKAMRLDVKK